MVPQHDVPNEIMTAAREAKATEDAAQACPKAEPAKEPARRWPVKSIGLGLGIGSAAIAGALLYAGRGRRKG